LACALPAEPIAAAPTIAHAPATIPILRRMVTHQL
jgi:hypothetical protein